MPFIFYRSIHVWEAYALILHKLYVKLVLLIHTCLVQRRNFLLFGKFLFSLVPTLALFLGLVEYAARSIGFRLTWGNFVFVDF